MRATVRHSRYYSAMVSPSYRHHRFVATYLSILLRNNGRYFGNLLETRLNPATFVGQGPATTVAAGLSKQKATNCRS